MGEFRVRGGPGRDLLAGGREPSIVPAMEDEPRVIYWPEDFLQGDSGNDILAGREGPDNLSGGSGADYLEGGPLGVPVGEESPGLNTGKDDTLIGGPGNDKIDAFDARPRYRNLLRARASGQGVDRQDRPEAEGVRDRQEETTSPL